MRDPATDLVVERLTEITFQYLCQRDFMETNEAINVNFARSRELLKAGWPHPRLIKAAMRAPLPARKRGPPLRRRDLHVQVAGAVAFLVEAAGLNPTRSHFGRRRGGYSACSIVTAALARLGEHLDERTVEGIWHRYRRSPHLIHRKSTDYIRNRYAITKS